MNAMYECTEKTTREEQGGVYVGVWTVPTPPHIPVLVSRLPFFQWIQCVGNGKKNGKYGSLSLK